MFRFPCPTSRLLLPLKCSVHQTVKRQIYCLFTIPTVPMGGPDSLSLQKPETLSEALDALARSDGPPGHKKNQSDGEKWHETSGQNLEFAQNDPQHPLVIMPLAGIMEGSYQQHQAAQEFRSKSQGKDDEIGNRRDKPAPKPAPMPPISAAMPVDH